MEKLCINGYEICLLPDKKLKTASFVIYISMPLKQETAAEYSVLPAVLGRGCAKIPETEAFHIYLEELFGASFSFSVTKRGAEQVIALRFKTISNRFANGEKPFSKLMALAGEILFHPLIENGGFRKSYTDREKENLKQYIAGVANDKRKYAKRRLLEEMCAGEEYSISEYGTEESVDSVTEESLYKAYQAALESANISFYVTDHFEKEEAVSVLEQMLEGKNAGIYKAECAVIKTAPKEICTIEEKAPVTQGKLAIGFRTDITRKDSRFYAMMLFNSLFGGAPYSKLFTNVREKLSLAYYASSEYVSQKGLVLVNSGIEFQNFELAKNEILKQLSEMQSGNFSEEEMQFAKLDIADSLKGVQDYGEALFEFYAALSSAGVADSPQSVIDKVMAVTKQEIIDAANTVQPDTIYFLKGEE